MLGRIGKLNHGIRTIEDLRAHLQIAIEIEHSTIPPYLCALYSLDGTVNDTARYVLRSVVIEEMLHMALAANVLNAIGGHPAINKKDFVVSYPAKLPNSGGHIEIGIGRFSREALETFLRIEKPEKRGARPEADHYETLGQFYIAIEDGLRTVCADHRHFTGEIGRQVGPEQYYGSGGALIAVTNLESALRALETIRHQGEGVNDTIEDGDPGLFGTGKSYAHFFRFNELKHGRFYDEKDSPSQPPSGLPLPVDFDSVLPMRSNPHAADYPAGSELREAADGFNRAYTAFLRSLHAAFNGKPESLREGVAAMYDLRYRATALMRTPAGPDAETAGPAFEFFEA